MFKKKKEPVDLVEQQYKYHPKFCRYDGNLLTRSREVEKTYYSTKTGRKTNQIRLKSFCPDWQTNRQLHTEFYGVMTFEEDAETGKRVIDDWLYSDD